MKGILAVLGLMAINPAASLHAQAPPPVILSLDSVTSIPRRTPPIRLLRLEDVDPVSDLVPVLTQRLPGWEEIMFSDVSTSYRIEAVDDRPAICSMSSGTASALVLEREYDPEAYPLLRFWLRVEGPVPGGDATRKEGDDFAARIFVNFAFDSEREGVFSRLTHSVAERAKGREIPGMALNYVWGNASPEGTQLPNAYSDRVSMVVVRSGSGEAMTWQMIERNIVDDYRAAFGQAPPPVVGVGLMTDSDDTGGAASACFGAISAVSVEGPEQGS